MHTHPNRVCLALLEKREECRLLNAQIGRMKEEIKNGSIAVNSDLASDIDNIMTDNYDSASPFMKLFWDEQRKSITSGYHRYHPMIIRFCLSLASKSGSAYDELRSTNILKLPSRRTLRDYKNAIRPCVGINPGIVAELIKTTSKLQGGQRFEVISFDEMKVKEDLVFDKHTGDLIGFVDLGDPERNYNAFGEENISKLASHVLGR